MKSAPNLQRFLEEVTQKHGVDITRPGAYLRLDLNGDRLILENLGGHRISIGHTLPLFNSWVVDPEIVLWISDDYGCEEGAQATQAWIPVEALQLFEGWQLYADIDASGKLVDFFDLDGQAELARFAEDVVALNLVDQGWLDRAEKSDIPRPPRSTAEMQARGIATDEMMSE